MLRAANGADNGVRVLDLNHDGYMDVVIGNEKVRQTRIWSPRAGTWTVKEFPLQIVTVDEGGNRRLTGVRFGVLQENGLTEEDVDLPTAIARASAPPPPEVPQAAYLEAVRAIVAAPPLPPAIQVETGATYLIDVPATAFVGPPSTFPVTISLVDENGDPLPTANNWVTVEALKANLEPASSTLATASTMVMA